MRIKSLISSLSFVALVAAGVAAPTMAYAGGPKVRVHIHSHIFWHHHGHHLHAHHIAHHHAHHVWRHHAHHIGHRHGHRIVHHHKFHQGHRIWRHRKFHNPRARARRGFRQVVIGHRPRGKRH